MSNKPNSKPTAEQTTAQPEPTPGFGAPNTDAPKADAAPAITVQVSKPESASLYPKTKKAGEDGVSCMAINVRVSHPVGLTLESAIWARLSVNSEGYAVDYRYSLPRRVAASEELFAAMELAVDDALGSWTGLDDAKQAASDRLTGNRKAPAPDVKRVSSLGPTLLRKDGTRVDAKPVGQTQQ